MNSITPFGKKWEWRHSLWLIWLLFPFGFLSYISMFYIGVRARKMKWIIAGFIYLLIVVQAFIVMEVFPEEHVIYDLSLGLLIFGWISNCVHAFLARIEYLTFLARQIAPDKMNKLHGKSRYNDNIASHQKVIGKQKPAPSKHTMKRKNTNKKPRKQPTLININTASESKLKQLPSVGPFLAKEIIIVREKVFTFTSYTHLVTALNVKPHVLAKAKPYIVFSDQELRQRSKENNSNNKNTTSTKSPPTKKQTGRVVDY